MYETLKNSKLISTTLIVLGIIIFLYNFVASFSISIIGIVTVLTGTALLSIIKAVRNELDKLRIELVEMRRNSEEKLLR